MKRSKNPDAAKTTQTIRVSKETARLINTLASWEDQTVEEFMTASCDELLRELLMKRISPSGERNKGD